MRPRETSRFDGLMDKEKLTAFLREYVSLLRGGYDFEADLPLKFRTDMPGACCVIETADGRHLATIQGGYLNPSLPVGPRDMAYARLFGRSVDLLIAAKVFLLDVNDDGARLAIAEIIRDIEGEKADV